MTLVRHSSGKYEALDSTELGEMALATSALIGDRVILRTAKHLYSMRDTRGVKCR